ncbi:hypothetical protein [Inquilinus sp. Marseille-Q2685]|uniref:hypothetical protein n=1 Tax=Inquilinus sp. Marseille-Q2685 TaxID=2866581 RepID=UPI001CE44737|nr:hypothetical protein [Inquilinus sp. Marseille-Q2685]
MKGRGVNATGRSKAEPFVRLPIWMLKSEAWRTLTPNAVKLLIDLWSRHNGQNNGEIAYAVRDAEGIGLAKSPAARAFEELVERGFLKVRRASTFDQKNMARTWELTAEPVGGKLATKDFMRSASPQRDTNGKMKSKSQSPQRDTQSPQEDTERPNLRNEGSIVPPEGLSGPNSPPSQSPQRDTSNIPGSVEPAAVRGDGVGPRQPEPATRTDAAEPRHVGGHVDLIVERLAASSSSLPPFGSPLSSPPANPHDKQYCYPPAADCERLATSVSNPETLDGATFAHWLSDLLDAGIDIEALGTASGLGTGGIRNIATGKARGTRPSQKRIVGAVMAVIGRRAA